MSRIFVIVEAWNIPSLIVSHKNHLLRVLPHAVGAKTFEHLMTNEDRNITALAFDSIGQRVYFADSYTTNKNSSHSTIRTLHIRNFQNM